REIERSVSAGIPSRMSAAHASVEQMYRGFRSDYARHLLKPSKLVLTAVCERAQHHACMFANQHRFLTPHGLIAVEETRGNGPPVLLIHGNSSGRHVFRCQMMGPLARNFRLIALDLPGHGDSSDAPDPTHTYTLPG